VAPFIWLNWDPAPIFQGWNAQFTTAGGLSALTFFELWKDSYRLPGDWWLLGLAWIPALGLGLLGLIKTGIHGFIDLLMKSTALILIFFLSRTWLSEPNTLLILPLVLILTSLGKLNGWALKAVWILPLVFTIFNTSPPQLLFPIFPDTMANILKLDETLRTARLVARWIVVVPWLAAGWWLVFTCFRKDRLTTTITQDGSN
jgi:hypothetical protein